MGDYVDIYCERTAQGLMNEPLNAITNLAFIISSIILLRYSRRHAVAPKFGDYLLIGNLFLIGIGSGLFHTFATKLTEILDMTPILTFQVIWLWLYFTRWFGFKFWTKLGLTLGYFVLNFGIVSLPDPTHGSIGYLGSLLVILGLGFHYRMRSKELPYLLLAMGGVFIVSLTLRSFDESICHSIPTGIHFMWHCLNAVVLWGCARCVVNREYSKE